MLPEYSGQYPDLFRHHCIRQKSPPLMIVCQLQIVKLSVEKQVVDREVAARVRCHLSKFRRTSMKIM